MYVVGVFNCILCAGLVGVAALRISVNLCVHLKTGNRKANKSLPNSSEMSIFAYGLKPNFMKAFD